MDMPIAIEATTAESFDLRAAAAELRQGPEYASNGRSAQTLAKGPDINVLLTVINEGVELDEHEAPGSVTLSVIEGKVMFVSGGKERAVDAGGAVVFGPGVTHSVRGVEEASCLLTIARPR